MRPRSMVNSATVWMALSLRSSRPATAHVCQYVVATMTATSRKTPTTASRVICVFTRSPVPGHGVRSVGDVHEPGQQREVRDDARSAVGDERQRDPRQRDEPEDAAEDDEGLQGEAEREPAGEQLREAV